MKRLKTLEPIFVMGSAATLGILLARYQSKSYRKISVGAIVVAVVALALRAQSDTDLNEGGGWWQGLGQV